MRVADTKIREIFIDNHVTERFSFVQMALSRGKEKEQQKELAIDAGMRAQ